MVVDTERIRTMARAEAPYMVKLRRDFHRHPELGMQEVRTAGIVAEQLHHLGLEVETGVAGTGVVGLLRCGRPGKTVALRADMDALPITDGKDVPYKSQVKGVMHACGHDAHVAMLLGVARILTRLAPELAGNVKFLFQPAEEGPGGAQPMIEAGVLDNPRVDVIVGAHVWSEFPVGHIGIQYGTMMAAVDRFKITILGQGGHGANPHETVDAVVVAAQVVGALQSIVSRNLDPVSPVVLSIGTINGGYRYNVIADRVDMTGTVRTLQPATRERLKQRLEEMVRGLTAAFGADYELEYTAVYPVTRNNDEVTVVVEKAARAVVGPERVQVKSKPSMGSEDFAYFTRVRPGCFFLVGCRNEAKGCGFPHHHPRFDIDEEALPIGAAVMVRAAVDLLG